MLCPAHQIMKPSASIRIEREIGVVQLCAYNELRLVYKSIISEPTTIARPDNILQFIFFNVTHMRHRDALAVSIAQAQTLECRKTQK